MPHSIHSAFVVLVALSLTAQGWSQNPDSTKRRSAADRPQAGSLRPGDEAPNFKLARLGGGEEVELASFRGKRPVVLIFGSYT
jgi:hypothetical protein